MADTEKAKKQTQKKAPAKKTATRSRASAHEKPEVVLADLRRGTADSESVRELQKVLAKKVDKSLKPDVTGTYDSSTARAVRTWQNDNGFVGGRGRRLDEQQASLLFGSSVTFADADADSDDSA